MSVLLRKALADVTRRKGRTMLAILGICIGVLGFTAVNEASDLIGGAFFYSTDAGAVPNMTFVVSSLPSAVSTMIQHMPNVEKFQVRTTYNTSWLNANKGDGPPIIEIDGYHYGQAVQLGEFQVTSGHWPGPGEIVMDESDQVLKSVAIGDQVIVSALNGHQVSLRVVGLARTRGLLVSHPPAPAIGYMSAEGLQPLVQGSSTVNEKGGVPYGTQILIQTHNANDPRLTYEAITRVLQDAHVAISSSHWNFSSGNLDTQLQVVGVLTIIRLLALLALVLVGVMIFTTITTLLTEQLKIVGTMKALGGTRWRIMGGYLMTVGIYSGIGTVLGLGVGLFAGYQLASHLASTVQYSVGQLPITVAIGPFQFALWIILSSVCVGVLIPLLSALWPLWVGTRITVREAMSAYGVRAGGATRAHAWGRQLLWVPQTVWLGLRGLFRRPSRVILTLLALTLSSAIFLAVQLCNDSLSASVDQGYNLFHSDIRIDLTDTGTVPSQHVISSLQSLPGVQYVEPIDPVVITISGRELRLMGLPADTHLYQPQVVAGRWLQAHEQNGLVINDYAAQQLNLHVGDHVTVNSSDTAASQGQRANWTIVGIVHEVSDVAATANPQGRLGLTFTTLDNLNLTLRHQQADAAERLWLSAYDHSTSSLRLLTGRIYRTLSASGLQNIAIQVWRLVQAQETGSLPIVYLLFDTVAILVAFMGLLGLTHTLAASVLERRLEVGILRSLGATGWRVGTVFVIEALALGFIAWGLGAAFGLPGGAAIVNVLGAYFGPIDVFFRPLIVLITLLFVIVVACVASFGPALSASRVRIRGTLRYE